MWIEEGIVITVENLVISQNTVGIKGQLGRGDK